MSDASVVFECLKYHAAAGGEYEYRGNLALEALARIRAQLSALREDNARLREAAQGCVDRSRPYEDESGVIAVTLGDFARLRAALASASPAPAQEQGEKNARLQDEYHTMDELYEHRFALTRALVALMPNNAVKCKKNGDGSVWEGFFVVYIDTPAGQVSYHYKMSHWDELPCREVEQWFYDGHTPQITLERLASIGRGAALASARPAPAQEEGRG